MLLKAEAVIVAIEDYIRFRDRVEQMKADDRDTWYEEKDLVQRRAEAMRVLMAFTHDMMAAAVREAIMQLKDEGLL